LYLTVDLVQFPVVLNGCHGANDAITLRTIVEKRDVSKGSYLGHEFYVSLDAIQDSDYLNFVKGGPTALIIGIDHSDPSQPSWGGLTRAVLRKLDKLSSTDAAALRKVVVGKDPDSGQIHVQRLSIPNQSVQGFPVDYLYIIGVKSVGGGDEQAKKQQAEILQNGLRAAMAKAKTGHISNLIIPCVGVDPNDQKTLQFREWFPQLFAATETSRTPARIYLSIYQDWSDEYRSNALRSLEDAWAEACSTLRKQSVLVREQLRLILVGAFICLLVSSLHVAMTVKNFLIISTAFTGLGFGAFQALNPFIQGWDAGYRLLATTLALLFLAVAFPYISKWNPRELFDKRRDDNE
jgi:hypothetical protein